MSADVDGAEESGVTHVRRCGYVGMWGCGTAFMECRSLDSLRSLGMTAVGLG
jgi:hypothetical protein